MQVGIWVGLSRDWGPKMRKRSDHMICPGSWRKAQDVLPVSDVDYITECKVCLDPAILAVKRLGSFTTHGHIILKSSFNDVMRRRVEEGIK
jgi:hypothetical protein